MGTYLAVSKYFTGAVVSAGIACNHLLSHNITAGVEPQTDSCTASLDRHILAVDDTADNS